MTKKAERKKICGIYALEMAVVPYQRQVFVGWSKDIGTRWRQWVRVLRNGKCGEKAVQAYWDEHGPGSIKCVTLVECPEDEFYLRRIQAVADYLDNGWIVVGVDHRIMEAYAGSGGSVYEVPDRWVPIVKRLVKMLENGSVEEEEVESALERLSQKW